MNLKVFGTAALIVCAGVLPASAGSKIIINQYGDYNSAVAIQDGSAHLDRPGRKGNRYGQYKQKKKVIINQYGTGNSAASSHPD